MFFKTWPSPPSAQKDYYNLLAHNFFRFIGGIGGIWNMHRRYSFHRNPTHPPHIVGFPKFCKFRFPDPDALGVGTIYTPGTE
jgi:hypothetical protein